MHRQFSFFQSQNRYRSLHFTHFRHFRLFYANMNRKEIPHQKLLKRVEINGYKQSAH